MELPLDLEKDGCMVVGCTEEAGPEGDIAAVWPDPETNKLEEHVIRLGEQHREAFVEHGMAAFSMPKPVEAIVADSVGPSDSVEMTVDGTVDVPLPPLPDDAYAPGAEPLMEVEPNGVHEALREAAANLLDLQRRQDNGRFVAREAMEGARAAVEAAIGGAVLKRDEPVVDPVPVFDLRVRDDQEGWTWQLLMRYGGREELFWAARIHFPTRTDALDHAIDTMRFSLERYAPTYQEATDRDV